jgi:hypothetical protein
MQATNNCWTEYNLKIQVFWGDTNIHYAPQKVNYLLGVISRKSLTSINTAANISDFAKQNLIMWKVTSGSPSSINICSVCQVPLPLWYRDLLVPAEMIKESYHSATARSQLLKIFGFETVPKIYFSRHRTNAKHNLEHGVFSSFISI